MAYRKAMSRGRSKKSFRKGLGTKKINHIPRTGVRGGIRL